jgi:hypothetical protein
VRVWAIGLDNMYWINTESNTVTEEYQYSLITYYYELHEHNPKPLNSDYNGVIFNIHIFDRKKLVKTKSKQSRFIMVDKN